MLTFERFLYGYQMFPSQTLLQQYNDTLKCSTRNIYKYNSHWKIFELYYYKL